MACEDAVVVVVEARPPARFEEIGDLGVVGGGAEVAPAVDDMHLGRLLGAVALDDADRAAMRPRRAREARKRRAGPSEVQMDVLLAGAHAGAAAELVAETRA